MDIGKILLKLRAERDRLEVAIEALDALESERKKKGAHKKRNPTTRRTENLATGATRSQGLGQKLARVIPIRKFGS